MKQFVCEEIDVGFDKEFFLEKNPPCPNSVIWREGVIHITELISAWDDFSRKGKQARNMRTTHLERASKKGSWGVGRQYFKIKDEDGRILVIYFDRAPKDAADKKGRWILLSLESF
jgi:hypothetical protein